jgi:hypothetical protein
MKESGCDAPASRKCRDLSCAGLLSRGDVRNQSPASLGGTWRRCVRRSTKAVAAENFRLLVFGIGLSCGGANTPHRPPSSRDRKIERVPDASTRHPAVSIGCRHRGGDQISGKPRLIPFFWEASLPLMENDAILGQQHSGPRRHHPRHQPALPEGRSAAGSELGATFQFTLPAAVAEHT